MNSCPFSNHCSLISNFWLWNEQWFMCDFFINNISQTHILNKFPDSSPKTLEITFSNDNLISNKFSTAQQTFLCLWIDILSWFPTRFHTTFQLLLSTYQQQLWNKCLIYCLKVVFSLFCIIIEFWTVEIVHFFPNCPKGIVIIQIIWQFWVFSIQPTFPIDKHFQLCYVFILFQECFFVLFPQVFKLLEHFFYVLTIELVE